MAPRDSWGFPRPRACRRFRSGFPCRTEALPQSRDALEELRVLAAVAQLRLGVRPPQHAGAVDEEIGALREKLRFEKRVVTPRHVPREVGEQLHFHRVLRTVFLQRRNRVHADGQHHGVRRREALKIVGERAHFRGAGAGERQREEREEYVLFPPEFREGHVPPRRGRERKLGRRRAHQRFYRGVDHAGSSWELEPWATGGCYLWR